MPGKKASKKPRFTDLGKVANEARKAVKKADCTQLIKDLWDLIGYLTVSDSNCNQCDGSWGLMTMYRNNETNTVWCGSCVREDEEQ